MAELFIDFGWQRHARGYRVAAAEPADQGKPWINSLHPEWGSLRPSLLSGSPAKPQRIVGISDQLEPIRPLERPNGKSLFVAFANIAPSAEGVKEFVSRHGPLTTAGLTEFGEPVPDAIEHSQAMKKFIEATSHTIDMVSLVGSQGIQLTAMDAALVWDKRAKTPRLRFSPRRLLDALWMQLAYGLSGGIRARECRQCGDIFTAGPGSNPPRRGDAEFCSPEHQIIFNSRKRKPREVGHA